MDLLRYTGWNIPGDGGLFANKTAVPFLFSRTPEVPGSDCPAGSYRLRCAEDEFGGTVDLDRAVACREPGSEIRTSHAIP
jgi:hypothetical protein